MAYNTFRKYYKENKDDLGRPRTFVFDQFEVRGFFSSDDDSHNRSPLGRIVNNLIKSLNDHNSIPQLIVVVMDDDVVRHIKSMNDGSVSFQLGTVIGWMVQQYERNIEAYKKFLPNKIKRTHILHILWILPPTHRNFGYNTNLLREKAAVCLKTMVEDRPHMSTLAMLKIWDHDDSNLFFAELIDLHHKD